jgi:hypothetical protein
VAARRAGNRKGFQHALTGWRARHTRSAADSSLLFQLNSKDSLVTRQALNQHAWASNPSPASLHVTSLLLRETSRRQPPLAWQQHTTIQCAHLQCTKCQHPTPGCIIHWTTSANWHWCRQLKALCQPQLSSLHHQHTLTAVTPCCAIARPSGAQTLLRPTMLLPHRCVSAST